MTVRTYQSKYGLSVNMDFGDVIRILATPYYSFNELKNSFIFNQFNVFNDQGGIVRFLMNEADMRNYGTDYQVPVYYIMGANDYNSPYLLAKSFFDEIVAPDKHIYSIPDADHMPFLSSKTEFDRILLEEIAPKLAKS